jgi:hypothetical protein
VYWVALILIGVGLASGGLGVWLRVSGEGVFSQYLLLSITIVAVVAGIVHLVRNSQKQQEL